MPKYQRALYYKLINKAIEYSCSQQNKLITIDTINLYHNELRYIDSLNLPTNESKVLLSLLVQYKLNKYYFEAKTGKEYSNTFFKGGNKKYSELKQMSNIPTTCAIHENVIHNLALRGLVTILCKGSIRLDFIDSIREVASGDVAYTIRRFLNIGYYWDLYKGSRRVGICGKCGCIFYKTSNHQKYCRNCQGYKKMELKTIVCRDCGKSFVSSSLSRKARCDKCKLEKNRKTDRNKKRQKRQQNMLVPPPH